MKRIVSALIVLVLLVGLVPTVALANTRTQSVYDDYRTYDVPGGGLLWVPKSTPPPPPPPPPKPPSNGGQKATSFVDWVIRVFTGYQIYREFGPQPPKGTNLQPGGQTDMPGVNT